MFSRSPTSASSSTSPRNNDDPHLEVTVTPCASAFYAGEVFSAVISFHNSRLPYPSADLPSTPYASSVPSTPDPNWGGQFPPGGFSSPAPTSPNTATSPDRAWSPASSAWRGEHARRPSGQGHTRRTQSLALGKGTLSPQEMVWALGVGEKSAPLTPTPPPLPLRRSAAIPRTHPHARKISLASGYANSPPPSAGLAPQSAPLPSINSDNQLQDAQATTSRTADFMLDDRPSMEAGPSRRGSSRPSPMPSPTLPNVMEEPYRPIHTPETPASAPLPPRSPPSTGPSTANHSPAPWASLSSSTSSFNSSTSSSIDSPTREHPRRPAHFRAPSYHNAYGTSLLSPPPAHPAMKNRLPLDTGSTTILWAHTRLVARFSPSHQHIPPDPLLPLKSKLLHQPIGSGSLASADDTNTRSSRWAINFGTGAIGKDAQPSFTGSLFGLAKGLVYGGGGGSLEEQRKRVWNTKDLPVLETTRSLIGVDLRLAEGETREFVYTLQLPTSLPPAFKGRALRFSYELVLSLNVALPGPGKRQRTKEITIPVRVWPNVSLANPLRSYNVLQPVIQTTEQASVVERPVQGGAVSSGRRQTPQEPPRHKDDSLATYARHLLETLDDDSPTRVPPSPSKSMISLSPTSPGPSPKSPLLGSSPFMGHGHGGHGQSGLVVSLNSPVTSSFPRLRAFSGSSPLAASPLGGPFLSAPDESRQPHLRPRAMSLVAGDDELVEDAQRCGEAVEILSRHSPKSSYDIRKDGQVVAVLTLIKTTYRLGETVLGVVTFNDPNTDRRVLKICAYLETHEVIPEPLLPPSASSLGRVRAPELRKVHAEHRSAYALHTARMPFSLDIPSDATPAFSLMAGEDGKAGGLEWRVRLSFLVAVPPRRKSASVDHRRSTSARPRSPVKATTPVPASVAHLLPTDGDSDNAPYTSAPTLVPFMQEGNADFVEARTEMVECEVPVSVLAGNTAFVVRPGVYSV